MTAAAVVLPEALGARLLGFAGEAVEACGLLVGRREGQVVTVTALCPAENRSPHPEDSFLIDPATHLSLQRRLRDEPGQTIVGCYHSHPEGRAEPSASDIRGGDWGGWEIGFVWIIIATGVNDTGRPSLAAFEAPGFAPLSIAMRTPCAFSP